MKKLAVSVILLLVLGMLVMPVLAASSAGMTVSASKDSVSQGDTFTVSVSVSKVENCATGGFLFEYDENVFEYVDGASKVSGFALAGVSTANGKIAGYFMGISGAATVQGTLFQITLRVKATAPAGTYTITGTPSLSVLNNGSKENISVSVNSATVTVAGNEQADTPTEEVTNTTAATVATEAYATDAPEATMGLDIMQAPTGENTETPSTQAADAPIGENAATQEKDRTAAGFPWWIPFALLGLGSGIAIVVILKKS